MVSFCHDLLWVFFKLYFPASKRCSVHCKGRFTSSNELYDERHCVGFKIRFNLDNEYSTQLKGFPCNIPSCVLDVIDFECFNKTLRNGDHGSGTECTGNFNF